MPFWSITLAPSKHNGKISLHFLCNSSKDPGLVEILSRKDSETVDGGFCGGASILKISLKLKKNINS